MNLTIKPLYHHFLMVSGALLVVAVIGMGNSRAQAQTGDTQDCISTGPVSTGVELDTGVAKVGFQPNTGCSLNGVRVFAVPGSTSRAAGASWLPGSPVPTIR